MSDLISERYELAQKILSVKQDVARAISDAFFLANPEWMARYGQRGRDFCTADAGLHIDFLSGAIEAGSPEAFADYGRWTSRMLAARQISAHTLEENFVQLEKHLSAVLVTTQREMLHGFLTRGQEACMESQRAPDAPATDDELALTKQLFLAAILSGKRQPAMNIIDEALRAGHSHVSLYVDVFAQSLYRVGELWEANKINVAQEHLATAITQYAIAGIYARLPPSEIVRGSMVITGVAGEMHQIGANLVADAMEANGWSVQFLGSNLPASAVVDAVEESSADILCISTTIIANLHSVAELTDAVRARLGELSPKIVVGGGAYRSVPTFAADVGASVFTDLRQALAALCPPPATAAALA
jgi:methanogenic corrinoid protein MtbC1